MPATYEISDQAAQFKLEGSLKREDLDALPDMVDKQTQHIEIDWSQVTAVDQFFMAALSYWLHLQVESSNFNDRLQIHHSPGENTDLARAFEILHQGEGHIGITSEYLRQSERWRHHAASLRQAFEGYAHRVYPQAEFKVTEEAAEQFFSTGDVPENFHVEVVRDPMMRRAVIGNLKFLIEFLDLPIIDDTLGDSHLHRGKVREVFSRKDLSNYGGHKSKEEFFNIFRNKRKLNAIANIYSNAQLIQLVIEEAVQSEGWDEEPGVPKAVEMLRAALDAIPVHSLDYERLAVEERLALLPEMSWRVATFLEAAHHCLERLASLPSRFQDAVA